MERKIERERKSIVCPEGREGTMVMQMETYAKVPDEKVLQLEAKVKELEGKILESSPNA